MENVKRKEKKDFKKSKVNSTCVLTTCISHNKNCPARDARGQVQYYTSVAATAAILKFY
jgi:hypothetical protein